MMTKTSLAESLEIFEVKPGLKFGVGSLRAMLADVETLLFFGKVYDLDYLQVSALLAKIFAGHNLVDEIMDGGHSTELQSYIVELSEQGHWFASGDVDNYVAGPPKGEILPHVWAAAEVEVAASIKAVGEKLAKMVNHMPGKEGSMLFRTMHKMNLRRPTLGTHAAVIHHAPRPDNLIILDVSSSMGRPLIETMVEDVVAMSYMANAHLAIVSNTTTHWEPGTYTAEGVLRNAEFGGTHYETLDTLLNRDWGVVVTVADYDSSMSAKRHIATSCSGRIEKVLDMSVVNQPTFLAETVGQLAKEVQPVLVATGHYVLSN